jgi:hypothetical protein
VYRGSRPSLDLRRYWRSEKALKRCLEWDESCSAMSEASKCTLVAQEPRDHGRRRISYNHEKCIKDSILPSFQQAFSSPPSHSISSPQEAHSPQLNNLVLRTSTKHPQTANMRFQVLSVFTTVLAASSAVAQLGPNAVVDAIKKITDLSDTTADVAESITSPSKALTNGLVRSPLLHPF